MVFAPSSLPARLRLVAAMIGFLSADFNVAADVRRTFLVLRRVERGQADFDASNATEAKIFRPSIYCPPQNGSPSNFGSK